MTFRTPTGQTGQDAYLFEAQAIANAQRELDKRYKRLRAVVEEEAPEMFTGSTDFLWSGASSAEGFVHYLQGREHYLEYLNSK